MANKKKSYKNQKAKRIRNKAKREGVTPQEIIANANKLEEERKREKEAKQREKARADREQRLDDINNRPKISIEEDAKRLIESNELDMLHDQFKLEQKWQEKIDLAVEERWNDRLIEIDKRNEEGVKWKEELEQKQRKHVEETWEKREEYRKQKETLLTKAKEEEELNRKNQGDKKWQEAQENKAKAELEQHNRKIELQAAMDKKVDKAWNKREFEQEYQNTKKRIEYEQSKQYHGPMTKEVSDMIEEFQEMSIRRERLIAYEERSAKWEAANPEQSAKLEKQRQETRAKWDDGWRPGHENVNVKAGVNEAAEHAMRQEMAEEASKNLRKSTMKNFGHLMNIGFAISDYKDAREAGHSTTKSLAKAGMEFVKGEMLGGWYPVAMLAKSAPTLAVSTIEGLNSMSRDMNSMSRRQVFGDTYFQDTQQLATMRQSGMELAKMSQYNLQQTLMGNEAEHLHRL